MLTSKKDEVTGKERKLYNEQLLCMYSPSYFWWRSIINDALSTKDKASKNSVGNELRIRRDSEKQWWPYRYYIPTFAWTD
jgi:hypothetical protein